MYVGGRGCQSVVNMSAEESDADLRGVINSLLESVNDKDEFVNSAIGNSLFKIATKHNVNIVMSTCCEYIQSKKKLSNSHMTNIVNAMEHICMQKSHDIDATVVDVILDVTIKEMTSSDDYIPNIQIPLSGVIVALGNIHSEKVIDSLNKLLKASANPHYTIPHTIGALAMTNNKAIVPFVQKILVEMLVILEKTKSEPLKQALLFAIESFSLAIIDCSNLKNCNVQKNTVENTQCKNDSIENSQCNNDNIENSEAKVLNNTVDEKPIDNGIKEELDVNTEDRNNLNIKEETEISNNITEKHNGSAKKFLDVEEYRFSFSSVFDYLFNHCLNLNEPSVLINVLRALGPMISLITPTKYSELESKLIPNILAVYKKLNTDPFYVTQTLSYILSYTNESGKTLSVQAIETVNYTLFPYVLTLPEYDQSQKIKNHFEVLRCYDMLMSKFSHVTLEFIYHRAKSNNDEDKMKAIVVLTHLLVSSETIVTDNFILLLKDVINTENSIKMKRILLKAIVALAYKQSLLENENSVLIEYIIKNICKNKNQISNEKSEVSELYNDCENSLYLLCSTVTNIKPLLWPLLLKTLMICKSNSSLVVISKCLVQLMQSEDTEKEKDTKKRKIPTNEAIFIRCLSLLNFPVKDKMFHSLLTFLLKYSGNIHKDLAVSWELELKHLFSYFNSDEFSNYIWESMILDLFRSAIFMVNDNNWIENISYEITRQIPHCEQTSQKRILYKFLAILLCNMINTQNVESRIDIYFNALPNSNIEEGESLAQALGITSVKHGFHIIDKLDELSKAIELRKSSRIFSFSFIKNNKHDNNINTMKYIITLCYGEIAKEVLDVNVLEKLVKTNVEGCGTSIRWIVSLLQNSSTPIFIIKSALVTLYHLAKSIHSVSHNTIVLNERWNLLNLVLDQVSENTNASNLELFPVVIKAITSLILLPKLLSPEERNVVLKIICIRTYNSILSINSKSEECPKNNIDETMNNIQSSLDSLIKDFMIQSTCPSTLDDILSILDEWIINDNKEIRITAMKSTLATLKYFIQNIKLTYESPSRFSQSGLIVGRMIPRCTDECVDVRKIAVDCLKLLIQIIDLYEGRSIDPECEKILTDLQEDIVTNDFKKISVSMSHIADIIGDKIQHQQIVHLTESLLIGMQLHDTSAIGCNIVLNAIFKNKGQDLYQSVEDIMNIILVTLQKLYGSGKESLLQTMLTFAQHHSKTIVSFLLMQPLPYEPCVNECWSTLAENESITRATIDSFWNILTNNPLFEESPKYESDKIVSVQSLAIISAMSEMLSQPQTKTICEEKFSDLFSILYTILVSFIGASPPAHSMLSDKKSEKFGFKPNIQSTKLSPAKITIDTMKGLLINVNCIKTLDVILSCNELESSSFLNNFLNTIETIVKTFCEDYPSLLPKLVNSLNQFSRSSLIPQRIAVVAFFGHLVKFRCNDNLILLDTVISTLNTGWKDTAIEVRAISLAGLSNVKCLKHEQQEQLLQSVVTSLYHGLDDYQGSTRQTNIPLIAIISLTELLISNTINKSLIDLFTPIALRIKAFMNTDIPTLREASIRLFGEIVLQQESDALKEQAFALLPCFLLHLADDDINVVKICKQTLKKISFVFNAPNAHAMIQNHLIDTARLHITEFLVDLTKCLSGELPQNVPQLIDSTANYLNSPWDDIRKNATVMIGALYSNYDKKVVVDVDYDKTKKLLTLRLLQLLKDQNTSVRAAAATALSGVYQNC